MNRICLIGNLTRDPELRTTQTGKSVCSFGMAVNRRRKVEGQLDVDFFNVTAWQALGENCCKYLSKGRKAAVSGQLQIRTYDAQDGTKRTAVDVIADEVEFLPSARDEAPPIPETMDEAKEQGFKPEDAEEPPF